MTIYPSHFNEIKLDLAIILLIGLIVVFGLGRSILSLKWQMVATFGYGLMASLWMIFRIYRVIRRVGGSS